MQYKFYKYSLADRNGNDVAPDDHYDIFNNAKATDDVGEFTKYRGQKNAVLMYLRKFGSDFSGLVGKHSTEREITNYDSEEDETTNNLVEDNDYPHAPFVCMPRLRVIACIEGSRIGADSAMHRLHSILAHRTQHTFIIESIRESQDIRKAITRFRVTEVSFEILPVNPHTGALGRALDEARAVDHIKRIKGVAEASEADPMSLDGGFLTQIQELQQSGHAKVGYKAVADNGIQISVSKPNEAMELDTDHESVVHGENVDVKVVFPRMRIYYPFDQGHITQLRTIARRFLNEDDEAS